MSQEFLSKLKSYLDERMKKEVLWGLSFKPFKIEVYSPSNKSWKWWVLTESDTIVRFVIERTDGTVSVESEGLDKAGDYILERLVKSYQPKFAKVGNEEEEKKVQEALHKEIDEACEDYLHRRNFEKRLKKPYWHAFLRLLWFDEVARRVSNEYGVKVEVLIDKVDYDSGLISKFDGSNMDEERKFEEIKKRVEAITAAYKLAYQAYMDHYKFFRRFSREERKDFLEFRDAILARYGIKRKRGL
ncbi:MAG: hypothetical protein FGF53_00370 [Candidatus Brockarchaeota archaeon]|nr:hypothetical protein [Candidatus Brockarchaeota archaeon]MBO3809889.1 hypothetical protein [Candidatus Brockarchaeota archaeon]